MKYKYVGILNPDIADKRGISEHKNKPILVYDDRIVIDRHLVDYRQKKN